MQSFDELYSPTRTRLIGFLRRSARTIPEMAEELGVSSNAVRSHVAALESDGVTREVGVKREGVGKPARVYDLTPAARERLSRAYAPVLEMTLAVLEEEVGEQVVREVLEEVGRRVGRAVHASGCLDERLQAARSTLEELGGLVDLHRNGNRVSLQGAGCPLGVVVRDHPGACGLATALLEEILGRPVSERCDRSGQPPRCRFELSANGDGGGPEAG